MPAAADVFTDVAAVRKWIDAAILKLTAPLIGSCEARSWLPAAPVPAHLPYSIPMHAPVANPSWSWCCSDG